jgi:hypothetical protein
MEGTPRVDRSTRANPSWLIILAIAGLSAFVFACGDDKDSPHHDAVSTEPASSHEEGEMPVVHVPTRWATATASDLRTLVDSSGTVFVGRVAALQETRLEDPFGGAGPSGERPRLPVSLFDVLVEASIAGGALAGATVVVEQVGGVAPNPDGSRTRYVFGGDEPMAVGERYLFFAATNSSGNLVTAPFGRIAVGQDGTLNPSATWMELGAVRQLAGLRVEDAGHEVAVAIGR